ncbi:MAG: MFS transporter [Methanosphaera sp.]|uniref:MFS transporter n=1 Tax=Methanosphaera sp. TaxID=2666342 RepID=UPI0025D995B9|nr:MFS transporter [Methanosphaera sp.]MCI5866518.1 MFS transporter [Methanosphaera sp.]MDD6534989.1 MFS transporter [Methanosphaera sp.]MDY3955422.1 MFS transporter [Methanosphaera sp.]
MDENKINKYVIIMAILSSFTVAFTSNAISVALPMIGSEFHLSNILQNWIVNIYLLIIAAVGVPLGRVASKYGLNRTLRIGIIIYIIGAVLSGIAMNIEFLFASRIIQAIGSAVLFVNVMSIITQQIPPQKRGQAIGLNVTGVYIGLSLAPTVSGIIVHNMTWRIIFYITIPLAIIAYYLLYAVKKEWITDPHASLDIKGSLLFIAAMIVLMYGFTILNETLGVILVIISLLMFVVFAKYELNYTHPIYEIRLFKNKTYTASNIASLISYFATFVVIYILNYHFQYIQGLDSQTTGIILIITPLLMAIVSPISGRISDKVIPQIIAAIGMVLVTIAMFIFIFIDTVPFYAIIVAMILQGVGFGLFSSPNNNVIMSSVDKKYAATASASLSTVRTVGQSFSLGLLSLIFAFIMGNVPIVPANYPLLIESSQVTMIISTILCIIAVVLSLSGFKHAKVDEN